MAFVEKENGDGSFVNFLVFIVFTHCNFYSFVFNSKNFARFIENVFFKRHQTFIADLFFG